LRSHEDLQYHIVLRELEKNRQTGLGFSALHIISQKYIGSTRTLSKRLGKLEKESLIEKKVPPKGVRRKRYFITPQGVAYLKRKRRLDLRFDFLIVDDFFTDYEVYRLADLTKLHEHKNLLLGWDKRNEYKLIRYFQVRPFSYTGLKKINGKIEKQSLFDFLREKQPKNETELSHILQDFFREYPIRESKIDPPETVGFGLGPPRSHVGWDLIPWMAKGHLPDELIEDKIEVTQRLQLTPDGLFVQFHSVYDLSFVRAIFLGILLQKLSLSPRQLGALLSQYMYRVNGAKKPILGCENLRRYDGKCKILKKRCEHRSNVTGCPRIGKSLQRTFNKVKHVLELLPQTDNANSIKHESTP